MKKELLKMISGLVIQFDVNEISKNESCVTVALFHDGVLIDDDRLTILGRAMRTPYEPNMDSEYLRDNLSDMRVHNMLVEYESMLPKDKKETAMIQARGMCEEDLAVALKQLRVVEAPDNAIGGRGALEFMNVIHARRLESITFNDNSKLLDDEHFKLFLDASDIDRVILLEDDVFCCYYEDFKSVKYLEV